MTLTQALNEAQTLADRNGYRVAIVELNGGLDIIKHQTAVDNNIKPLEIIRPSHMEPPKAFKNLLYRDFNRRLTND